MSNFHILWKTAFPWLLVLELAVTQMHNPVVKDGVFKSLLQGKSEPPEILPASFGKKPGALYPELGLLLVF